MTAGEFVSNCTADALISAAQLLKAGGLVALPTETVYGLGADATNASAVARIYEVKGRPADHPVIVHIADLKYLEQWISNISEYAIENAKPEIKKYLQVANATKLPFKDDSFDFVMSVNTVHNLNREDCATSLQEIERVSRGNSFITVETLII